MPKAAAAKTTTEGADAVVEPYLADHEQDELRVFK